MPLKRPSRRPRKPAESGGLLTLTTLGERLGRAGTPLNSRIAASVLTKSFSFALGLGVDRDPPMMVINPEDTPARPTASIRTARNGHRARYIVIQWFGNEGGASCQSCRPGDGF